MLTIDATVRQWAESRPDHAAIRCEERSVGYGELWSRAQRVASALTEAGLRSGDRIAWLSKNDESALELLVGASAAGIVLVPVNWRLAAPEILDILADSQARACFVHAEFSPLIERMSAELPHVVLTAVVGAPAHERDYRRWRDGAAGGGSPLAAQPDDIALQLYTSGTTGRPKGAMLSHRSLLATKALWRDLDWNRWRDDDVGLVTMPMFHIGGMGLALMALAAGATSLLLREFDAVRILELAHRGAFTRTFLVPAALQMLVRHPRAALTDFRSLRMILYGASPMPPRLLEECMALIGCEFAQQYGMTETCGTVVALAPEDHRRDQPARLAAAGRALPGVEIEIRDPDGNPLPAGVTGQIAIRSVATMSGYWRRPQATAEAIDSKGWLLSGDGGMIDEDGYLFVQDRLKDMIISGGENIYPTEVENALTAHPHVAEAAVIGVPDERWGEAVIAFVVSPVDHRPSIEELKSWVRTRIAAYKVPKDVRFVEGLPRNASGKILRRVLRES
jgi:acyl-CoA synthetase (AMP-forming)/AMP-acid ligase II